MKESEILSKQIEKLERKKVIIELRMESYQKRIKFYDNRAEQYILKVLHMKNEEHPDVDKERLHIEYIGAVDRFNTFKQPKLRVYVTKVNPSYSNEILFEVSISSNCMHYTYMKEFCASSKHAEFIQDIFQDFTKESGWTRKYLRMARGTYKSFTNTNLLSSQKYKIQQDVKRLNVQLKVAQYHEKLVLGNFFIQKAYYRGEKDVYATIIKETPKTVVLSYKDGEVKRVYKKIIVNKILETKRRYELLTKAELTEELLLAQ